MKPSVPLQVSLRRGSVKQGLKQLLEFGKISKRTIAAKIGEKAHPCEKPSVTGMMVYVPSDLLTIEYLGSAYKVSVKKARMGYLYRTKKMRFLLKILLNIYLISRKTGDHDGKHC